MKTDTGKIILIFVGLLILLGVYLYGTRFEMVSAGEKAAFKINRLTGDTSILFRAEETPVKSSNLGS